jgi:uncharacterized protein with HEPN domain
MYIDDMVEAVGNVVEFSKEMERDEFFSDKRTRDATLRNLEVLGEAAKKIPDDIRATVQEIPWRRIAGLRDVLAHDYFGLDKGILWDVVTNEVPSLMEHLKRLRRGINE